MQFLSYMHMMLTSLILQLSPSPALTTSASALQPRTACTYPHCLWLHLPCSCSRKNRWTEFPALQRSPWSLWHLLADAELCTPIFHGIRESTIKGMQSSSLVDSGALICNTPQARSLCSSLTEHSFSNVFGSLIFPGNLSTSEWGCNLFPGLKWGW